ncbi:MAG TPA: CotH kinase family protein [Verrucomicrobiae bacterium]|nr:CotH kinase family protein [Verrucomicrobiae bacterium]
MLENTTTIPSLRKASPAAAAVGVLLGTLALAGAPSASAAPVIHPSGGGYLAVAASSQYSAAFPPAAAFDRDVAGVSRGTSLSPDFDWAISGTGPAYLRFELAQIQSVTSIFYAQRTGNIAAWDKVDRISIWTGTSAPFAPADPGVLPHAIIPVTNRQSAIWTEYALPSVLTGRYFLFKLEQTPAVGGNIGASELRLGAAPPDISAPALAYISPSPGAAVPILNAIEVGFSEPVGGLDASDLLINNVPAESVVPLTPSQFLFTFQPAATGAVNVAWAANHGIRDISSHSNLFAGSGWSYAVHPQAGAGSIYISEFLASNSGDLADSLQDELGNAPDWIEIHNASDVVANLTGWFLTDDAQRLSRWKFPPVLIPANGYLVVFASDRNTNVSGRLHTNFKLSAGGGYLALANSATNVISEFSAYPQQQADVSYGRDRLNPDLIGYFTNPTPGSPNAAQGAGFCPPVEFSHSSGTFVNAFSVSLSVPDPAAKIRYVLVTNNVPQGSNAVLNIPTTNSLLYTGPITVSNTMQVRARAFPTTGGLFPGPPGTESFVRLSAGAAQFTSDIPIILLDNIGGGLIPASRDQNAIVMVFEPVSGVASMTNPPSLVTRAGINIRGLSTAGFPKSSFAVEAWDEFNDDRDVRFCGMPAESDWVLYAPNQFDIPLIHNPLMHQLSRDIGRYASRTRFAEVFVNQSGGNVMFFPPAGGNYNGVYVVEEKIKRGKDRVDVDKLEPGVTAFPEVTGGYIFKNDAVDPDEVRFFAGGLSNSFQVYVEPPGPEMVSPLRSAQNQFFTNRLNTFYAALNAANWTNPITGYAQYFDVDAGIDHHLLNVLALNADAFRISGYAHIPRNGKITMGPIWDFDRALGTSRVEERPFNPRSWRGINYDGNTDFFNASIFFNNAWYRRLFRDPDFWQRYVDRYQDLRSDLWSTNRILALVDTLANEVRAAQPREVARWGGSVGSDTSPRQGLHSANGYSHDFGAGSYQSEIDFLKRWLLDRMEFIDTNFLARPNMQSGAGLLSNTVVLTITGPSVPGSVVYYTTNGVDPRSAGGGISPSARVYGSPITLARNSRIMVRARNTAHRNLTGLHNPPLTTPWSGLVAKTIVVQPIPLAVTEIMYHPPDAPIGNTNDADNFEFIELRNVGAGACNLAGVRFTNGIQFTFQSTNAVTNLGPGDFLVLVKNRTAFLSRYPQVTNIAGQYTGSLDNSGERLRLEGAVGETIADFRFGDDWLPMTDGNGFSLVARNEAAVPAGDIGKAAWRSSSAAGGSPGEADPVPADSDSDGLPDTWEMENELDHLSDEGFDGRDGDPDGDGMSNWQEFIAGTLASNPASRLMVSSSIAGEHVILSFSATAGRSYSLQQRVTLESEWQFAQDFPASGEHRVLTITNALSDGTRFYRVVTPGKP